MERWRARAADFEKRSMWAEACRAYEEMGRKDRTSSFAHQGYHRCLRRLHITIRHTDGEYRAGLSRLTLPQALDLYTQILSVLSTAHPDRDRASMQAMFGEGLAELRYALDDPAFRRSHFPDVKESALNEFKAALAAWPLARITTKSDARSQAHAVVRAAAKCKMPMRPGVMPALLLEFAAGACNSLDEHSLFVTPGQLGLLQAALRGKLVSTGLELGLKDEKLQVSQVAHGGPAAEKGIRVGDLVHKIGGVNVEDLLPEAAAERLRGDPDTTVEVVVSRAGRVFDPIKLTRRAAPLPSVEFRTETLTDGSLCVVLRINYFGETTLADVKGHLAAASMNGEPLKSLILDLRGNPGGLFDSAVSVAELFLPEGVIVIGNSPFKKYNRTYRAETPGPYQMPVIVLIDTDTASAAEVLAGAIKDTRGPTRGAFVWGQASYGKGSIQCLIPLEKTPLDKPAALRLTVAKLYSPGNLPYTGRGITPDPTPAGDPLQAALEKLPEIIKSVAVPMPPASMPSMPPMM
jgi:carboxyl-terminal processing protease